MDLSGDDPQKVAIQLLADLQRRIAHARQDRRSLRRAIQEADIVVDSHHSEHALLNITLDREAGAMRERIAETKRSVALLQRQVKLASAECDRLTRMNSKLRAKAEERDEELQRLKQRQAQFELSERKTAALQRRVLAEAKVRDEEAQAMTASIADRLLVSSKRQEKNMSLEQILAERKLEAEDLRRKLGLPTRRYELQAPLPFITCPKPECQAIRSALTGDMVVYRTFCSRPLTRLAVVLKAGCDHCASGGAGVFVSFTRVMASSAQALRFPPLASQAPCLGVMAVFGENAPGRNRLTGTEMARAVSTLHPPPPPPPLPAVTASRVTDLGDGPPSWSNTAPTCPSDGNIPDSTHAQLIACECNAKV